MIINRRGDSVWINTSKGVTVYFHFHSEMGRIAFYVNTPCGVSQHDFLEEGLSVMDGKKRIRELDQADADKAFEMIMSWESNKNQPLDYFQQVSYKEPLITNP